MGFLGVGEAVVCGWRLTGFYQRKIIHLQIVFSAAISATTIKVIFFMGSITKNFRLIVLATYAN